MAEEVADIRCTKEGCEVAATRACSEGHTPPESCPYYRAIEAPDEDEDNKAPVSDTDLALTEERIPLPRGDALGPTEVDKFLRRRPATLIVMVGDRDSGKTTLIYSIYDRFLKGPFAGYMFAGSTTLVGLEKRSHEARVDSGRTRPDTRHTSLSEGLTFLHFGIAAAATLEPRVDLMLSDRAGELYRNARSDSNLVPELVELVKADRIVLLLDGGRITNPIERAGALQSVRQALQAFLDGSALNNGSSVQVWTVKADLFVDHLEKAGISSQLSVFCSGLERDFGPRLGDLSFWEVSARDPSRQLPAAYGVDRLFASWVTPRRTVAPISHSEVPLHREFDKLLLRTPMETKE